MLRSSDCEAASFTASAVDYNAFIPFKRRILETAWRNFCAGAHPELQAAYEQFRNLHSHWLEDYALFRALKARHNDAYYLEWPVELIRRIPAALARARQELASQIDQVRFAQFLLYRQAECTGYRWCVDRLRALLRHVDAVRLDHFRGFAAAWHVPAGTATAQCGHWVPGPGAEFFEVVQRELGGLPLIAEDLRVITPDVSALRDRFHVPGTRVLQFAFDGHPDNPHLLNNYTANTVVYTGTHDNPPTREWCEELPASQRQFPWRYLKRPEARGSDAAPALMELAWSSPAALAIVPLQDVLNLGAEARMNLPGRAEGNWRWRCPANMLSVTEIEWLRNLTKTSSCPGVLRSLQTAH